MRRLPFVSAQIVMGPAILRATRIYRRCSVMCPLNTKIQNSQLLNISDALQLSPHTKLET